MVIVIIIIIICKKDVNFLLENECYLWCCVDVVNVLIEDYEVFRDFSKFWKDINFNSLCFKFVKKYKFNNVLLFMVIIVVVFEYYKKYIFFRLIVKFI